jgi:hypothetical protein
MADAREVGRRFIDAFNAHDEQRIRDLNGDNTAFEAPGEVKIEGRDARRTKNGLGARIPRRTNQRLPRSGPRKMGSTTSSPVRRRGRRRCIGDRLANSAVERVGASRRDRIVEFDFVTPTGETSRSSAGRRRGRYVHGIQVQGTGAWAVSSASTVRFAGLGSGPYSATLTYNGLSDGVYSYGTLTITLSGNVLVGSIS